MSIKLDIDSLPKALGGSGWNKKDNTATEYSSGGSNYRTYRPTATPKDGGLFITTKINHIRGGGGDDWSIVKMTFDASGKLADATGEVEIGDVKFDTGIITAAKDDDKTKAAAEVFNKLTNWVAKINEKGGRKLFPSVIQHNMNVIIAAVKG